MQIKAISATNKKLNAQLEIQAETNYRAIDAIRNDLAVYRDKLQMACDVIGSELDNNDLLRAMLCDAEIIDYNSEANYMQVSSRQVRYKPALLNAMPTPENITTEFIYKLGMFVREEIQNVHFGKIYEVNHNGKRQCLFLDEQSIRNMPFNYLVSNYLPELIGGLKEQCNIK